MPPPSVLYPARLLEENSAYVAAMRAWMKGSPVNQRVPEANYDSGAILDALANEVELIDQARAARLRAKAAWVRAGKSLADFPPAIS